ncbi:MAG TPA: MBL fold metallo-hydrolase [Terriglobales bacterium]|nr:MBL fold metallo-hydrolase [Terriglobales bacterium]
MFTSRFISDVRLAAHVSFRRAGGRSFGMTLFLCIPAAAVLLTAVCLGQEALTSKPQPQTLTGTRLITLGTSGGPLPVKDRTQSSNLLIVNGVLYLIDAGDNVTRRIVQSSCDFRKVDKVFITHAHSDHTLGLATLMGAAWEFQRSGPMDIYGPPGIRKLVDGAVDYLSVNAEIRSAEGKPYPLTGLFRAHELPPGVIFHDNNVNVIAVENTHFHFPSGSRPFGKHKSYSYRFETSDRIIVFTGDSGPSDALISLAKGADVLVTEVVVVNDVLEVLERNGSWKAKTAESRNRGLFHMREEHMTPEQVGSMAAKAGVKTLVMSHLPPTVNPKEDYQRYVEAAKKYFSGRIIVARDLSEF